MNIGTNTNKIQEIMSLYLLKIWYSTKLENPKEMDEFWGAYGLPKLNQEEINNVNTPITSDEVEPVIKNLLTKRSPRLEGFGAEFYHTFKEDLTVIFLKLFHKIKRKRCFQISFYKASIVWF